MEFDHLEYLDLTTALENEATRCKQFAKRWANSDDEKQFWLDKAERYQELRRKLGRYEAKKPT